MDWLRVCWRWSNSPKGFTGAVCKQAAALIYTRLTLTAQGPDFLQKAKNFKPAFSASSFYRCVAAKLLLSMPVGVDAGFFLFA